MNQDFLQKLITRRKKQIAFLKKWGYTKIVEGYENDILLAQKKIFENKLKK
jgi:hypothetical protein